MTLRLRLMEFLYPELRSLPASDRTRALAQAKQTPFDFIELVGMGVGLIVVTALTSYTIDHVSVAIHLLKGVGNFLVALPLLALFLGPFIVRRTRRGLRLEATKATKGH